MVTAATWQWLFSRHGAPASARRTACRAPEEAPGHTAANAASAAPIATVEIPAIAPPPGPQATALAQFRPNPSKHSTIALRTLATAASFRALTRQPSATG
ncbi:hypothetical protein FBX98_11099 [Burkholderia sp. SJZ115]|nr:hypothetical protein FB600_110158 [Burkholderia sp. SJZ089]TWD00257.1 hypothetical protein FBX98_11099 [Burkholderia sp. SJZ115]TWD03841.1 hypothetical protein FB601_110158 [Burkholderia sp. SJZ091]